MTRGLGVRHGKRDANENEIVEALRAVGATVVKVDDGGVPDLLVHHAHTGTILVEVKAPDARLTNTQREWWAAWSGRKYIVRDVHEALCIVGRAEQSGTLVFDASHGRDVTAAVGHEVIRVKVKPDVSGTQYEEAFASYNTFAYRVLVTCDATDTPCVRNMAARYNVGVVNADGSVLS